MGTISSGVGLISGLDIEGLVTQLIAIEARPKDMILDRIENLTNQQTAFMTIQARIMSIQIAAANFNKESVFQQKAVSSSNEDVITATGSRFAALGSYRFRVKRLASNHHFVSRGYSSRDSSLGQGTVSFEIGQGQLNRPTDLSFINGHQGFQRGKISITDRAGATAEIDLSASLTMQDIIEKINQDTTVNVTASVSGDHLVITDNNGDTATGNLIIADVGTGKTATSLGIAGAAVSDPTKIIGSDLISITSDTRLSDLNDGNGIRRGGEYADLQFTLSDDSSFGVDIRDSLFAMVGDPDKATTLQSLNGGNGIRAGKFRITDQNGLFVDIDLNELYELRETSGDRGPLTLSHVADFIQAKVKAKNDSLRPSDVGEDADFDGMMKISFTFNEFDHIKLADNSEQLIDPLTNKPYEERKSHFIIEDLDGGFAAADLGIADDVAAGNIAGDKIWSMDTVGDLVNAVNNHWDNYDVNTGDALVEVDINSLGSGLKATDLTGGGGTFTIAGDADSRTAIDMGIAVTDSTESSIEGWRLIGGLNTVLLRSLNGGNAGPNQITDGGVISLTDREGNPTVTLDIAAELGKRASDLTLQDVLDVINDSTVNTTNITARINDVGNGIILEDTSTTGTGNMVVADAVGSTLAEKLGITVTGADAVTAVDSGNLQLQYISEATLLDDLRQGSGIRRGKFSITDSSGATFTIDLTQNSIKTLGDVVDAINNSQIKTGEETTIDDEGEEVITSIYHVNTARARINDTGDGIILQDYGVETEEADGTTTITPMPIYVEDLDNGNAAHDLGLTRTAKLSEAGDSYSIDGSYEYKFELGGGDSLDDIVSRINEADIGISASILNDGSGTNPYRISFNSEISGFDGNVYFDAGTTGMTTQTLSQGRDAIVLFGEGSDDSALLISSSENTIKNAIKGTTLELHSVSDQPVDITVAQDLDAIVTQMKSFVDAYNGVMTDIAAATKFDPETLERGMLFNEHTISRVRDKLQSMVSHIIPGSSGLYHSLYSVGVKPKLSGTETSTDENGQETTYMIAGTPQLDFDETAFREALADDPEAVEELFTRSDTGIGDYIADLLDSMANTYDSSMQNRVDAMGDQVDMLQDRVDYLTEQLSAKEERLYRKFYSMEQVLANMQAQQSALAGLSNMVSSMGSVTASSG